MTEAVGLTEFIIAEVQKRTSEEAVRSVVESRIDQAVKAAVENAFRSYGNLGQQIEKTVTAALQLPANLDIPSYGAMVLTTLRLKMDEVLADLVEERLAAEMAEILGLAPKEVKLSEVVEKMKEDLDGRDRYGGRITCDVEDGGHGFYWISLDPLNGKRGYDAEARLGVSSSGEIYSLSLDRKDVKQTIALGRQFGWRKMLLAAHICGAKFIVDEENVARSIGDD